MVHVFYFLIVLPWVSDNGCTVHFVQYSNLFLGCFKLTIQYIAHCIHVQVVHSNVSWTALRFFMKKGI